MSFKLLLLREEKRAETHLVDHWTALIKQAVPSAEVYLRHSPAEAQDVIGEVDAAFGNIVPELFIQAKKLRWLASPQAGPEAGFYHRQMAESDVVVTNTRGIYNDHIAHIMAYVLTFARGLHLYRDRQRQKNWQKGAPTTYLPESTALVIGVGGIGGEAARLCSAFGMTVIGIDARLETAPAGVSALHRPEQTEELLPKAEFVIVTVPETPATQGYFNAARFAKMKKGAYFINIGRGKTTELADLDAALRSGHLAGAGLDVYQIEPLPSDHPLWDAPGAVLTPHVAADGPYLDDRRTELFIDNCKRFAASQPLRNVVDKLNWF